MAYQALYRQWRPKTFSEMVAQQAVVTTLRNQVIGGRISHAYLFCGSRGTGKTSSAKILARAINCEHPVNGDPCNECPSCLRILREESLDVVEIDAATNTGVDNIRDLRDAAKYPPQYGKYKVYIIDEVHMLSAGAFNGLLKTLEEPPEHVVFILATTDPQKMPATVLSRCQRFDFGRIPAADIAARLRQAAEGAGAEATDGALMMIARAAEGGLRDALSILDMCLGYRDRVDEELVRTVLGTSDRSFLFAFSDALQAEDAPKVMALVDQLMREGREPMVFARDMSRHLRSLLTAKLCPKELPALLEITPEAAADYVRHAEALPQSRLMDMMELFMAAETEARATSSPRLALEKTALRCCLRTAPVDTLALQDALAETKKELSELRAQIASGAVTVAAVPASAEAAQSAPKPKPPARKPGAKHVGEAAWKDAMTLLMRSDPGIHSFLTTGGRFIGCEGDVFRWQSNEADSIFMNTLNKEDSRARITQALTEAAGEGVRFEAVIPGQKEERFEDDGFLKELKDTFPPGTLMVQE